MFLNVGISDRSVSDSKTIYAMNVTYHKIENGHYEGSFTLTSDNEQFFDLKHDFSGKTVELKKYKKITLKTPDSTYHLSDASLTGYSDSINLSKEYSITTIKFVCNRLC